MVFPRRDRDSKSQHTFAKGVGKSFALILLTSTAIVSCSSSGPKEFTPAPSVQTMQTSSGLKLTSLGRNQGARFSPDGRRVLFISSQREQHSNAQLYELSLDTFRERRVTYHDGDCLEADYSPDGRSIIYASTTDEIKENPILLKPKKRQYPTTELYLSDPRGMQIERLTHMEGYQGQVAWVSERQFLFVTEQKDRLHIDSYLVENSKAIPWKTDPKADLKNPAVDATGHRSAWILESAGGLPKLGYKNAGKIRTLVMPFPQIQSLQWLNATKKDKPLILMSARRAGDKFLGAWLVDPDQDCAIPLLQEAGNLKDLRASNDREKLLFTYEIGENSQQIYLREFPPILAQCEPLTPQEQPTEQARQSSASTKPADDPQEHPKTQ